METEILEEGTIIETAEGEMTVGEAIETGAVEEVAETEAE